MTDRELLTHALGWLDGLPCETLRAEIKERLEQPEQEPVAWREFDGEGGYDYRSYDDNENFRDEYIKRNGEKYAGWVEALYTTPPAAQPEDEEVDCPRCGHCCPQRQPPQFPTMLRKMWSGAEVQEWINEHWHNIGENT